MFFKVVRMVFYILIVLPKLAWGDNQIIKVALLDNLRSQKLASVIYEGDYLAGMQVAILEAKKRGVKVVYRYFKYERGALDILAKIPELKEWNPDYIIGPRSSDKFLLLKPYFKNIVVVSPLATANAITSMPPNFYSLSLPNTYMARVFEKYINKNFPKTNKIYIIAAMDCKSCYEVGKEISVIYHKMHPNVQVIQNNFFADEVEKIDISKSVAGFSKGDIIISPNLSYVSGVLMARIVNYLKMPNLVFIGSDGWASSEVTYVGKLQTQVPFLAYHMCQWSIENKTKEIENFKKIFYEEYKKYPHDTISYAAYNAVIAAVDAYLQSRSSSGAKEKILDNFKSSSISYRSKKISVYKQNKQGEQLIGNIDF